MATAPEDLQPSSPFGDDLTAGLDFRAGETDDPFLGFEEFVPGEEGERPPGVPRLAQPRTDPTGERAGTISVPPRFRVSDVERLKTMSVAERTRLKLKMIDAGLISPKTTTGAGTLDPEFFTRYEELLTFANLNGFSNPLDAIDIIKRDQGQLGGNMFDGQLPAPEDVRMSVRLALQEQLGRAPEDMVGAMIDGYTKLYRKRAETDVAPPSVEGFVEQQVKSGPGAPEAGAFEFNKRVRDFYGMLGGFVPSPTPTEGPF